MDDHASREKPTTTSEQPESSLDGSNLSQSHENNLDGAQPPPEIELVRLVARLRFDATTGNPIPHPPLRTANDLLEWFSYLEMTFKNHNLPKSSWADAAILFLAGDNARANMIMRKHRSERTGSNDVEKIPLFWEWNDFLETLKEVLEDFDNKSTYAQLQEEHPVAIKVASTGLAVAGAVALTPVVIVGGLNALGFTAGGVAAGSIAAGVQSAVYGGATTGIFSVCQAIGATSAVPGVVSAVAGAGTLLAKVGIPGWRSDPQGATSSGEGDGLAEGVMPQDGASDR